MTSASVLSLSPRQALWVLGVKVWLTEGDFPYALTEIEIAPHTPGPPPHQHTDCNELFYPLTDNVELFDGTSWRRLAAFATAYVPRGTVHTFRAGGNLPARFMNLFDPAGFERFFRDLGVPQSDPDGQAKSVRPEVIERVLAHAGDWGMILALPPTEDPGPAAARPEGG